MKKTKAKKAMEKPEMEIVTPTPVRSEELEIRFLNACAEIHKLETERDRLNNLVMEESLKVYKLEEAERIRVEKKKAAWKFAGKMGLMFLFSAFCAVSAAGCSVYAPWWTMIAPMVLFLGGLWTWLRWI